MVPMGTLGVGRARCLILFMMVALTLVGIAMAVQGASSPPASGDWVVTSAETVHIDTSPLVNTTKEWVLVTGHMEGGRGVTINRHPAVLTDGAFSVYFPVPLGDNLVTVESRDAVGNTRVYKIIVNRTEPAEEEPRSRMWVLPFILVVLLLAFAEWYYFRGRFLGGDAR